MPDEPTIPDLSDDGPIHAAPTPATVAELIRAEQDNPSYDGLGTIAPSEVGAEPLGDAAYTDNNVAPGPNTTETTPILDDGLILEPEDDPEPYDDSEPEDSLTIQRISEWHPDHPGSYNRTVMFGDHLDTVAATIYYQNYQPFAVEIIDYSGDVVTISTTVLGHIAVLAQQFSGVGGEITQFHNRRI